MSIFTTSTTYVRDVSLAASSQVSWTLDNPVPGVVTPSSNSAGVLICGYGPPDESANLYIDGNMIGLALVGSNGSLKYTTAPGSFGTISGSGSGVISLRDTSTNSILSQATYNYDSGIVQPSISSVSVVDGNMEINVNIGSDPSVQFDYHVGSAPQPGNDATRSNDIGDSVGVGSATTHTFYDIPYGTYTAYIRVRYSYDAWADNGSNVVAEGRYVDLDFAVDNPIQAKSSVDPAGSVSLPIVAGIPYGSYNDSHWQAMMNDAKNWGAGNNQIKTEMLDGRPAHIHKLTPTAFSSSSTNGSDRVSGAFDISTRTEATLIQWVRAMPQYAMGQQEQSGKWGFGLGGGSVPSGGQSAADGFSLRLSPFGDKTYPDTQAKINLGMYVYSADKVDPNWGDELKLTDPATGQYYSLIRGVWTQITMYCKMNSSAGASDGILRAYVDGVLMLEQTGKRWFSVGTPHIDQILVGSFHGGANGLWAPSRVNEIAFADMSIG